MPGGRPMTLIRVVRAGSRFALQSALGLAFRRGRDRCGSVWHAHRVDPPGTTSNAPRRRRPPGDVASFPVISVGSKRSYHRSNGLTIVPPGAGLIRPPGPRRVRAGV